MTRVDDFCSRRGLCLPNFGLLAIRTHLGRVPSLSAAVGTATIREGVRYLPLPHPSGVSRWLNEPVNQAAVRTASDILRGWVEELGI